MKKYRLFMIFIICLMLAGFAGSIIIMQKNENHETDIVLLNDIAQTAKRHLDDIERMQEYEFGAKYVIFDSRGSVIYAAGATDVNCLMDVVKKQYPYLTITENGKILGSAAILENQRELHARQRKSAFGMIVLSGICMTSCMLLWSVYVRKQIVDPFRKMERFAGEVAAGNLDAPLEMEKDNLFGAFTESFDIMREELADARERENILKRKEKELVASLSHDLKTPITGIKLTAELMMAQTTDPGNGEKLEQIYQKADQIDALVSDLFTSTLKDLGEMSVLVGEEEASILHGFVESCDDRKLVKEGRIPECMISIDKRRMPQIIGNIISNSYKYAGTPIHISYVIIEGYLKMSIRDHGPGVPEEELKLLTNKFYRSRAANGGKADGSGLGLYIAKLLIEKMGGEIRCLNAQPGFEIRLLIPLA